jgi:hypothetical protein
MRTLTDKQLAFCNEYVANGYNGAAAYRFAYQQENDDICKSEAYKMVRLPQIQEGIKNAELDYRIEGHGLDINKKAILTVIKNALAATKADKDGVDTGNPDYTAQLKAIEVYAKLTGDFSPEKKTLTIEDNQTVDITKLTPEEREAYKAKILAEL